MTAGPESLVSALLAGGAVLALHRPVEGRQPPWVSLTALLVAVAVVLHPAGPPWRLLAGATVAVAVARRLRRRQARRRQGERRVEQVREMCEVLAGEVAAGAAPVAALETAADGWPELGPVLAGARLGGSVPDGLRRLARLPGGHDLHLVAAAWELSQRTGAPLGSSLATVAGDLRERSAMRRTIRSELASARATARLVIALPVLTLGAGSGLGGAPVRYLLATPAGFALAGTGAALVLLGLWWLEAIASSILDRDP